MATGGGEDITDNAAMLAVEEEQVNQQTEGIFLRYVFYTAQLRREEDEDCSPLVNELANAGQVDSNIDKVGQQLALIGDDLNRRYEEYFSNAIKELNPNLHNAYDYFKKIASSVLETGVNWGRVITLLGFGYQLAVFVWRNGRHRFLRTIAQWLGRYLVESSIARWIARQGGWAAALKRTNPLETVLKALAVYLVLQFVIKRLGSGS